MTNQSKECCEKCQETRSLYASWLCFGICPCHSKELMEWWEKDFDEKFVNHQSCNNDDCICKSKQRIKNFIHHQLSLQKQELIEKGEKMKKGAWSKKIEGYNQAVQDFIQTIKQL